MVATRKQFIEQASNVGAAFRSSGKAEDYMAWLATQRRRPYLLIATYREAKPCLQAIRGHKAGHPVLGMVLLAETDVVFRRAQAWAQSQQGIQISVFQQPATEELATLLAHYGDMVFEEQSKVATKISIADAVQNNPVTRQPSSKESHSVPRKVLSSENFVAQCHPPCVQAPPKNFLPLVSIPPPCRDMLTDPAETEIMSNASGFMSCTWLMEAVRHQSMAAQIHQDLLEHMPAVYED